MFRVDINSSAKSGSGCSDAHAVNRRRSNSMSSNGSGTAMKQNKPAQQHPKKLLFVVASVSVFALYTFLLARMGAEKPAATLLRKTAATTSSKANAGNSSLILSNHSHIKPDGANTSVAMTAAPISSGANANDPSSALSNSSYIKSHGTIVTAFYEGPSKHSLSKYEVWAKKLFSLKDPMIIFTTPSFAPFVQEHRVVMQNTAHKTKIVLLDLNKTDTVNMFDPDFWKEQYLKDKRKETHKSYHVYWVWLSKLEFIRRAVEMNPFQSEFFAWVDMGYFRNDRWLGEKLLQHIPNALQEDQVLMLDHNHKGKLGGGFIGGYSKGLLHYGKVFYDHLKKRQYTEFIGREEPMLAESCLVEQNLCELVVSGKQVEEEAHAHEWNYMAPFLILGQNETEALIYSPTVASDKVQDAVVNYLNYIRAPEVLRSVLMVVAHPDDEVLWGGEYLLKEGQNVHVVVTSTLNKKTARRYDEFMAVQEHLGYHGEFLDGEDSTNTTRLENHIQQRIQTLICGKNWERIITHGPEGEYGHPHHQMVHDSVLDAVTMCCDSSDKLFVFEPHRLKNHVFSEAKQAVAKLYKSQKKVLLRTFGDWKEQIVPFQEYDYESASKNCRDNRNPKKEVYKYRQCRLHQMFNFSSSNYTSVLSRKTFSGQGSGC